MYGMKCNAVTPAMAFYFLILLSKGADGTLTNGPNAVISMLDHALSEHGFGEMTCSLHADNCSGKFFMELQNKQILI
jgi:hypothetical protein